MSMSAIQLPLATEGSWRWRWGRIYGRQELQKLLFRLKCQNLSKRFALPRTHLQPRAKAPNVGEKLPPVILLLISPTTTSLS